VPTKALARAARVCGMLLRHKRAQWGRAIEVFNKRGQTTQIALFAEDRTALVLDCDVVSIRLCAMRLRRPRQWGACP
jgi:hypothetical protein